MGSVEVWHLRKWYSESAPVLEDLSFRYEGQRAIGYLGSNGAGKTATRKRRVRRLRPFRGGAEPIGLDSTADRRRALGDLRVVTETPEPCPTLPLFEARETQTARRSPSREGVRRPPNSPEVLRWRP